MRDLQATKTPYTAMNPPSRFSLQRVTACVLCCSVVTAGCSTAQLQQQYKSFDECYRSQKTAAMVGGALGGAALGRLVGGSVTSNSAGRNVATAAGAALGAVIGQKIAWEQCLGAFPPRMQTTLVVPEASASQATTLGRPALAVAHPDY